MADIIKKIRIGTSEYDIRDASVPGQVATAKAEAIAAAADDATTKANEALSAAKTYAEQQANATVTAVTQDSSNGHIIKVTKNGSTSSITIPDNNTTYTVATGTANGKIKITPSSGSAYEVPVYGLKSAAYTESSAYDAAGTAQTKADAAEANAKAYTYSQADIDLKDATTLSNAKTYADGLVTSAIKFQGTKATEAQVKAITSAKKGDLWLVTGDNSEWLCIKDITAADATAWEKLGNAVGTVTSITAGTGLTGGTITSSGTIAIDDSVVATKSWSNTTFEPKFTDGSAAPATVNTTDGTISIRGISQSSGKIGNGSAISGATAYTTTKTAALINTAKGEATTYADQQDALQYAVSNGDHTHTVTAKAPVYKVNPTNRYLKNAVSGGAVTNSTTQYISDLGTPTKQYLVTDSIKVGTMTGITPASSPITGFTTSYDEAECCLTLTPGSGTFLTSVTPVTNGTTITYATGASTSTTNTNANFVTAYANPTKSVHGHGFTQPTVTLSATTTSTDGPAFVQSVGNTAVAYEDCTNITVSTTGAHEHTIGKHSA